MIKRMNKKKWYDTLDKYSELAAQRKNIIEECGIDDWDSCDKSTELIKMQENLLQQKTLFIPKLNELHRYCIFSTDNTGSLVEHEIQLGTIFLLVENLEPISKGLYQNSFVNEKNVLHTDMIYVLFFVMALFLYLMLKR